MIEYQLKRNYKENPLKITTNGVNSEKPYKEDLNYLFIDKNMSINELKIYFNVSKATVQRWLKFYNIQKPKNKCIERKKISLQEIYNVDNISKLPYIRDKARKTCKEKYGEEYYTQSDKGKRNLHEYQLSLSDDKRQKIINKMNETMIKRYGVNWFPQTDEYKQIMKDKKCDEEFIKEKIEKSKQTCKEKYGVDYYIKSKKFEELRKQILLEKYGTENISKLQVIQTKKENNSIKKYGVKYKSQLSINEHVREILYDKEKLEAYIKENNVLNCTDLAKKLNIRRPTSCRYVRRYNLQNLMDYTGSIGEREVREFVNQFQETVNNSRQIIPPYEIDIFIPKLNIAIEYNGDFWHRLDKTKEKDLKKIKLCENKGIKCLTITEHDWENNQEEVKNKLKQMIENK